MSSVRESEVDGAGVMIAAGGAKSTERRVELRRLDGDCSRGRTAAHREEEKRGGRGAGKEGVATGEVF